MATIATTAIISGDGERRIAKTGWDFQSSISYFKISHTIQVRHLLLSAHIQIAECYIGAVDVVNDCCSWHKRSLEISANLVCNPCVYRNFQRMFRFRYSKRMIFGRILINYIVFPRC